MIWEPLASSAADMLILFTLYPDSIAFGPTKGIPMPTDSLASARSLLQEYLDKHEELRLFMERVPRGAVTSEEIEEMSYRIGKWQTDFMARVKEELASSTPDIRIG